MILGVTGATGFVGRHFTRYAAGEGHTVIAYSRQNGAVVPGASDMRPWPAGSPPDLSGLDALIHLAGESVLGRWTTAKKQRIRASRIDSTRRIVEALATQPHPPAAFISASGVSYYGDAGSRELTENAPPGHGFLAEVSQAWEHEAGKARAHGVRVAHARFGMVLGPDGGAWPLLRTIFRAGLGGRLGSGRQWLPWIHIDDAVRLLLTAATDLRCEGPLNAVSPTPITNREFTRLLAQAIKRPALLPAPAFALKLILGEQASMLLDSQRVLPEKALACGFTFQFPDLAQALRHLAQA